MVFNMDKEKLEYYAYMVLEQRERKKAEEERKHKEEVDLVSYFEDIYDDIEKGYNITSIFEEKFGENIFKKVILECDEDFDEKLSAVKRIVTLSKKQYLDFSGDDLIIELVNGKRFEVSISEWLSIYFK